MDPEQFDSVQLLSIGEIIEIYYLKLRDAMDNAASSVENKNGFDGNLAENDAQHLAEFCMGNQVSELSQTLGELLICLERHNEEQLPDVRETAIYNTLLRVEKVLNNTSSWEIFGTDSDGPLLDLTTFELNMIEQHMSLYIVDLLSKNTDQKLFFPLSDFYSSDAIVKWRILEKIATIKLFSQETIYKQKLKVHLKERLKNEISGWLKKEMEYLKLSGTSTILKDTQALAKILKEFRTQVIMAIDVTTSDTLFKEASCNYLEAVAEAVDDIIFPVCEQVMSLMDGYQMKYRDFHVNTRDSCALSHALYLQLKKLADLMSAHCETDRNLKLQDYTGIFSKFFVNLLQVMKLECHNRIKRAVEAESKDSVHFEEQILSSSVIVLNCICTVIDEWKHMEIEDEEQKIAFLVKISDIICDGAKIFAESLEHRLETMNPQTKDIDALKKVCVLANSIEHVSQYLQELPQQMQWSEVLEGNSEDPSNISLKEQVLRILTLIHQSMNNHMLEIVTKLLNVAVSGVHFNVEKVLIGWLTSQGTMQAYDKFLAHLNDILKRLNDVLKEELFSKFLSLLWPFLLSQIKINLQEGQPPEYASTLKENILNLNEYFINGSMIELDSYKPLFQQIMELLDLYAKSTEELQLDYYVQIAESIISPVEYLGHIAFQAGYKTSGNDTVDLYIHVQKGQRLPARKFEMSNLVVKVELLPNTLFPSLAPLKSRAVNEDLDNPIFNECFELSKLPANGLNVKGAVIQVLVLNQDYSYSAEAILLLNQVQNMSGFTSLEFLPVYLMPLRKFDMSHISYRVLESRSRWDKNAKVFINKRAKVHKSQKKLLSCISVKKYDMQLFKK